MEERLEKLRTIYQSKDRILRLNINVDNLIKRILWNKLTPLIPNISLEELIAESELIAGLRELEVDLKPYPSLSDIESDLGTLELLRDLARGTPTNEVYKRNAIEIIDNSIKKLKDTLPEEYKSLLKENSDIFW